MDTAQFDEFKELLAATEERLRTGLRIELLAEMKELLTGSESRLRKEMRQGFGEVRQEMAGGFQSVRSEMAAGFAGVANSFENLNDMIEDQQDTTSRRLTKLERQTI